MKNILLFFSFILSIALGANAQSKVGPLGTNIGTIEIEKQLKPAIISDYNLTTSEMEDALKQILKNRQIKFNEYKNIKAAKGVKVEELGIGVFDVYISIEKKGKAYKNMSTFKLAVSSEDNFLNGASEELRKFNDQLGLQIEEYCHQLAISAQTESIQKAEKKYNDAVKESLKLAKQQMNLEKDIADNKKEMETLHEELNKQKKLLEDLNH